MKKRITAAALALVMVLSMVPAFAAGGTAYASTQSVEVNGKKVEFQMYALRDASGNGTNYVKLRDVAHVLNGTGAQFSVGYDNASKSISIATGQAYADVGGEMTTPYTGDRTYQTGSGSVLVDSKAVNLEAIVLTDDQGGGYTYFKLRDLGAALGFKVDWSAERGVIVETGAPSVPSDTPVVEKRDITLDDLQGVWYGKSSMGTEIEWIFNGNQFTRTFESSYSSSQMVGTITAVKNNVAPQYPLVLDVNMELLSLWSDGRYSSNKVNRSMEFRKIDLAEGYIFEYRESIPCYKTDTEKLASAYQKAYVAAGGASITIVPKPASPTTGSGYSKFPSVPSFEAYSGVKGLTYTREHSTEYRYSVVDVAVGKKAGTSYEGYYQLLQNNGFKVQGELSDANLFASTDNKTIIITQFITYLDEKWFSVTVGSTN